MSSNEALSILLAGPNMKSMLDYVYPPFKSDPARFNVLTLCEKWGEFEGDVASYKPEVVVLEAAIAPEPLALRDVLARFPAGTLAIVVLPSTPGWPERRGAIEDVRTTVRGVFIAPVNWSQIAAQAYTAGITERTRKFETAPAGAAHETPGMGNLPSSAVVGTRIVAATSFAGGTGKSTILEAIAVELARNHVKTLLCSFNSPPAVVGHMGLKFGPNAVEWFNRPTTDGFRAALQSPKGHAGLDVLLAPEDPEALATAADRPTENPLSIRNLIHAATSFNYGVILLDLPPFADSMWAVQGVLSANMALLVSRPTVHDQFAALRAYRLFTQRLAAQHRVPLESIFAVINFTSPDDNMSPSDFVGGLARAAGGFPPILASFPYVAQLPAVQNRGMSPMLAPETAPFANAANSLASKLIGGSVIPIATNGKQPEKGFLGIRIKIK